MAARLKSRRYARVAILAILFMVATAPLLQWGAMRGMKTMFNAPLRWIPRESPSRADFNEFVRRFDSHEMVLLSWPGCTVDDERLEEVAEGIRETRQERLDAGKEPYFSVITTGYGVLRDLTGEPLEMRRAQALERLRGLLVGPDDTTSCAVIYLTDLGARERRESVDAILSAVQAAIGLERDDLRLAGPPIDGIAIDNASMSSIERFATPSVIISLVLCVLCLRSVWLSLPVLAAGAYGQVLMLGSVYYSGSSMNAVLIVLPPLVFVLTISAGVHLVNYFYEETRNGNRNTAVSDALRRGWGPCALAAVTTAIGLVSLTVSEVWPVRQFGVLAAFGVLFCVPLLFLLLPGAMAMWVRWRAERLRNEKPDPAALGGTHGWQWISNRIWQNATAIRIASFVLLVICGVGLTWLSTSINVVSLLSPENRAVRDFRWFERNIGPLVPVEVIVHFGAESQLDALERLALVRQVHRQMDNMEIIEGSLSASSFFPVIPGSRGIRATLQRAVLRNRIKGQFESLQEAQYLAESDAGQWWRISARIPGEAGFDYGGFLNHLADRVGPVIERYKRAGHEEIDVTYTGVTAVVYEVQASLLADLFTSYLTALALVAAVMVLALRSVVAGLLAMIPNVFPTVTLFGAMGWLGWPVGIGTVMTASVALGMAVDGTFHFIKWFRHEVARGRQPEEAAGHAFQHCGRALVQTTVICASGLLIYVFSDFLPARSFAWVLLILLVAAMIGDLVVLPALLSGRLGRLVTQQNTAPNSGATSPGQVVTDTGLIASTMSEDSRHA